MILRPLEGVINWSVHALTEKSILPIQRDLGLQMHLKEKKYIRY